MRSRDTSLGAIVTCALLITAICSARAAAPAACPAGPAVLTFIQTFEVDSTYCAALLAKPQATAGFREIGGYKAKDFLVPVLRKRIAGLSGNSESLFAVGIGICRLANGPAPDAFVDAAGEGLIVSTFAHGGRIAIRCCQMSTGNTCRTVAESALDDRTVLLFKLTVHDRSLLVALRCEKVVIAASGVGLSQKQEDLRQAFRKSQPHDVPKDVIVFHMKSPPDGIECVVDTTGAQQIPPTSPSLGSR